MKILSLSQPYASLMALQCEPNLAEKGIETRSWSTQYRGPLAIHAAKNFPKEYKAKCEQEPFLSVLRKHGLTRVDLEDMGGHVVAVVDLYDCVEMNEMTVHAVREMSPHEPEFGIYAPGRYAWMTRNPQPLPVPVPVRGGQGLRNLALEQEALVLASIRGETGNEVYTRSWDPPGHELDLDQKFWAYHYENPLVYEELLGLAMQARSRGRAGFGMKMVFEVVRWNRFLETNDPDGWKLNNNYHSRYARLLMSKVPELRGLFELRELRS